MPALTRLGIEIPTPNIKTLSSAQKQTADAFGYKWQRRDTYDSPAMRDRTRQWLIERYCAGDATRVAEWLKGNKKLILDAGCGSGYTALLLFGEQLRQHDYLGIDISNAVEVARERFHEADIPGDFFQSGIFEAPIPKESLDIIFSEGVMHHTDSVQRAIEHLSSKLKPGGLFLFYVYLKKGPVREFTDDLIRDQLRDLNDEAAWDALMPLTMLGQALGATGATVNVPEDVPMLGISKGEHSIQRLFYWNMCKAFYDPKLTLDEMNHINFDWFRPLNCWRHEPEEIHNYCTDSGLVIEHEDMQPSGITVVARKV